MDEDRMEHRFRQADLPETHRYGARPRTDDCSSILRRNQEAMQNSPMMKRKLQVTIDPLAFAKAGGSCTPICKRRLESCLRDKNSGSFPNTPQAMRRAEISNAMMSVSNSPVVSRRSELISDAMSSYNPSPVLSRRSEILFSGDSGSASSSPLLGRRLEGSKLFGSPARSIGEPGVFSSPVHSIGSESLEGQWTEDCEEADFMEADKMLVSGWLKFRDNKRWKQRWGVVTKLSPAADCLHLQLYRDSKDRYKKGQTKASLSLQHFLGFESGFTLDKESNTIAIICQDVIVVLAFDTRERLIQWQVKISSNLGEGQQYLVLIATAPTKTKVTTGPAKLHIQDHRFCLTAGVPPRLIGIWEIVALRRYGVVEGRFCFEGGSRCGKGEGLHVLITDQGEEITHTFTLASQGKLSTKKRTLLRKMSNVDSPKKQFRPDTRLSDLQSLDAIQLCSEMNRSGYGDENCCIHNQDDIPCGTISPYWPSVESQTCQHGDIDSNYGCGDTASVSEMQDAVHNETWAGGGGVVTLERCMSCISKLGAMSRSSTVNAAMTPCAGSHFHPAWTMESVKEKTSASDRNSLSSRNSSSGSTEYSIPRFVNSQDTAPTPSSPTRCQPTSLSLKTVDSNCKCPDCPPARPPKVLPLGNSNNQCKINKPPMPLPNEQCTCQHKIAIIDQNNPKVGPYENYDVPKMHFQEEKKISFKTEIIIGEHYDTPKKIKECLARENMFQLTKSAAPGVMTLQKPCGCILKLGRKATEPTIIDCDDVRPPDCPCQRITSWANNLISLPYCRKPPSGDDKNATGDPKQICHNKPDLALYATVDVTKKTNRKTVTSCICKLDGKMNDNESDTSSSNYVNIDPATLLPEDGSNRDPGSCNYANLDFAQSLEYYENAKDMLKKAGITSDELDALQTSLNNMSQVLDEMKPLCTKCGHHQGEPSSKNECGEYKNDDYLMMEPATSNKTGENPGQPAKNVAGYTPMSPATGQAANKTALKTRVSRLIVEKSASNPTLFGPPVDRHKKRSESEMRIPGSAMVMSLNSPNSPYARKQIMDSTDSIELIKNRKRSSSADSSRYLEDLKEFESISSRTTSSSLETLRNISIDNRRSSSPCIHQETEPCEDKKCCVNVQYEVKSMDLDGDVTPNGIPVLRKKIKETAHIRRSSSVPCKSGPNRDSSSSNDSGVSTCSLKHHGADFTDFELPLTTSMSSRRHNHALAQRQSKSSHPGCLHSSLPRKSKSSDPLRDLTFQFQKIIIPAKSSSAEAEVPVCPPKATKGVVDSHSSSSGASDMSDYIETLSMSSHSSSDTAETLRINRQTTNTLRPRSGKEYHSIDQTILSTHPTDARISGWI